MVPRSGEMGLAEEHFERGRKWPRIAKRVLKRTHQSSTGGKILVRSYSFVVFTFFTFLQMLVSRPDPVRFL